MHGLAIYNVLGEARGSYQCSFKSLAMLHAHDCMKIAHNCESPATWNFKTMCVKLVKLSRLPIAMEKENSLRNADVLSRHF